jgi:methionyl-tRNA formyltransferase
VAATFFHLGKKIMKLNKKILLLTKPNFLDSILLAKSIGMYHDVTTHVEKPEKIKKWEEYDLVLSYFYPYIIKKDQLDKIKFGVNCHISFLPFNRGSMPNVWAIADGTPAGVTIHTLAEEVDAGEILFRKEVEVYPDDTGYTLYNRLCREMYNLTVNNLGNLLEMNFTPLETKIEQQPPNRVSDFHNMRDLGKSFSEEQLVVISNFLDMARAASFDGNHKGVFLRHPDGRLYINDLKLEFIPDDDI